MGHYIGPPAKRHSNGVKFHVAGGPVMDRIYMLTMAPHLYAYYGPAFIIILWPRIYMLTMAPHLYAYYGPAFICLLWPRI